MKMKKTNWTLASKSTRISGGQPEYTVAFVIFWFEMGYGFRGNYRSVWFQFQMRKEKKKDANLK